MLDELLKKFGLSFEDLDQDGHSGEREYLLGMVAQINKQEVTLEGIQQHVSINKSAIENDLVKEDEFEYFFFGLFKRVNRRHLLLKARLKNYLLLEAFLDTPEKAKKILEVQLSALASSKGVNK